MQWKCRTPAAATTTTTTSSTSPSLPFCKNLQVNGSCPSSLSFSPYMPLFLTNSTQTSFSYPIYQQTVCQSSRALIACPASLVIHVYAAYFGIQSATMTSTCTTTGAGEIPLACYFTNAFNTINSTCEYQTSCNLRATVNAMAGADLCPNFQKQLTVQYQVKFNFFKNSCLRID